jgi:hypothetical protein
LWRCGDGLFFEVPPLASDALLENVLQTVCHKLQEDSGAGGFDLGAPFSWLERPRIRMGSDLDCMVDVLMGSTCVTYDRLADFYQILYYHNNNNNNNNNINTGDFVHMI